MCKISDHFSYQAFHHIWANYSDQTAGWSPQMVVKSKGIPPKCPENFRFRNYSNLPRSYQIDQAACWAVWVQVRVVTALRSRGELLACRMLGKPE